MSDSPASASFRFTIARKLLLSAALNLLLLAAIGGYAINQINLIGVEIEEIAEFDMPLVLAITNLETHQLEQARHLGHAQRIALQMQSDPGLLAAFKVQEERIRYFSGELDREVVETEAMARAGIDHAQSEQDKAEFELVLVALEQFEVDHQDYEDDVYVLLAIIGAGNWDISQYGALVDRIDAQEQLLSESIEALLTEIERFTQVSLRQAEKDQTAALQGILLLFTLALLTSVGIATYSARQITRPINTLNTIVQAVALGDLNQHITRIGNDEIGDLGDSMNTVLDTLNELNLQAQAMAKGDFSLELSVKSDRDQLALALVDMKQQIQQRSLLLEQSEAELLSSNQRLTAQNALKTQVSSIAQLTQGALELQVMCDGVISALAQMTDSGHGVLYVLEEHPGMADTPAAVLSLMGSYAFKKRKNILAEIPLGEGLVGQCGKERKAILLTQAPPDYIQINSALGEQTPLNILVVPILHEGQLMGVIELASFHDYTDTQQQVVQQVTENLGVVVNSIRRQEQTRALLEETQRQSEELQTQQEELQSTNENLREQTERLKASEEELKQQSEELQVSNEELQERQHDLRHQKDEIEAAQIELTRKAEELALASKYKSEFLANMSHELRTPLNSLLLLAKGLADNKQGNLDETQVEDAHVIYSGGSSLLSLINDIMDLSKVEAGKLNIHIEEVSFDTLRNNLDKMFAPLAREKKLTFEINIADTLPPTITTDGLRLEQILRNLLSNAMKFTLEGQVELNFFPATDSANLSLSGLSQDTALALAVVDTGVGIPADKQQEIFEAFQQQDGSTSRKYGGTGLGLTIARELTHLLGGELQLSSTEDKGSTFTLYLPPELTPGSMGPTDPVPSSSQATAASAQTPISAEPSNTAGGQWGYPKFVRDDRDTIQPGDRTLLVIDDEPEFAQILRDFARNNGYKCLVAGDGRSGVLLAQEYQPHGIILDLGLPDIDGNQVLEQLKYSLKTRGIPVQIISGREENQGAALVQGAIGYLTKPVREAQLQSVLEDISQLIQARVKKILVIEDDKANQKATAQLLENKGLEINCVGNGKAGVTEVLSGDYDCVILDLGLPDISGFEVLSRITAAKLERNPPIIIYTGKELSDAEQSKLQQYSSTIVIKGVGSPERLLDDVSLFLHDIEPHFKDEHKQIIGRLHDEDAMLKDRRILLVDDDMRNTYALSKKLIDIGFDVEMASNGEEAVKLLETDKSYELVLMDTMMPIMDGNEATICIRNMEHYKHIPIIALTAKTMPEDRERALQAGASEYLTKPIDFERLLSVMRIWLFQHT